MKAKGKSGTVVSKAPKLSEKKARGKQESKEGFDKSVGGAGVKVPKSHYMGGPQESNQGFDKSVGSAGGDMTGKAYSTIKKAQKGPDSDF